MSDLERRKDGDIEEHDTVAYVTTALAIGLLVAAVLVVMTAGVPAAGFPFILGAAALFGVGISRFARGRRALRPAPPGEWELLAAIRDNGGSITPAEAAMETSLTVRDADRMLSGLAGEGHLLVESRGGALYYRLPGRWDPALEGSDRT